MVTNGDSYGKPPMLKDGEYDWWVKQITHYICSIDGQVWRVIQQGPYEIKDKADPTKDKKKEDYDDADYKCLEKNSRAIRIILQAIPEKDSKMVLIFETAKEMWDALKELYSGNLDVQRNRILSATREYEKAVQGRTESLEAFHSRFRGYVGQLSFLGKDEDEWMITHKFLKGLNSNWRSVVQIFQAQPETKNLTLEQLVARLRSNADLDPIREVQKEPETNKSLALKIEKALELSKGDEPPDEEDPTIALMTRAFRMNKFVKNGNDNTSEPKNFNCFRCGRKGHIAKDCRVKLKDVMEPKENKKAMIAAWDASDEDDDTDACLMAKLEDTSDKVISKPSSVTREDLINALQNMVERNEEMVRTITENKELIEDMTDDNQLWAEKVRDLELDKKELQLKIEDLEKIQGLDQILNAEKDKLVLELREQVMTLKEEKGSLKEKLEQVQREKGKQLASIPIDLLQPSSGLAETDECSKSRTPQINGERTKSLEKERHNRPVLTHENQCPRKQTTT